MMRLAAFFNSMTGRMFAILLVGVTLSAAVAWGLAETKRQGDLHRLDMARAVDRVEDAVLRWTTLPADQRAAFEPDHERGLGPAHDDVHGIAPEPVLAQQLTARLPGLDIEALRADPAACRADDQRRRQRSERGGAGDELSQDCWLVTVRDGAAALRLLAQSQPRPRGQPLLLDPVFMGVVILTAALLALLVARMSASPLRSLSRAATELGDDLTRSPLPLNGPSELRQAAAAFNAMQVQLQRQLSEKTHMLAAITHDLQTPVTRLRLRLEKVQDSELRDRLLGDLAAMQTLIREGLDLARTADHAEDKITVDLQSLVDSIIDDAADAGQAVTPGDRCEIDLTLQPEAMRRVICNLIDNALKYGGAAKVSVEKDDGGALVRVRDHGPGIPEDKQDAVFDPFVRLENSRSRETGGAGLGLTIARTLAARNNASITLANHASGGAEAVVRFRSA